MEKKRIIPENSTPIINPIIEKLACAKLTNYEFNIIMAIIRQTYGWNKKEAWISGSILQKLTKIPKENCYRTIKKLINKNIIIKNNKALGLNKKVEDWKTEKGSCLVSNETVFSETAVSNETVSGSTPKDVQRDTKKMSNETPIKEIIKKTNKNNTSLSQINLYEKKEAIKLSYELLKRILENNPKFRYSKSSLENWVIEIDRMLRIDQRTYDEIFDVIEFSQMDDFWQSNILSAKKLREKYDQLWIKMQKNGKNSYIKECENINEMDGIPDFIKNSIS